MGRATLCLFVLLILTTTRRLAVLLFVFLAWTPAAYAWSRPVQGPVVQPFAYDEAHPYAAGQHRGIDIAADAAGEAVVAPAAGTISFAGTVPTNGKSVTIETADGYSVTLTHLGSIAVLKGATVAEQDAVGTIGPSGTPEVDEPYVHLGIRVTADPNGYVDPLRLLPPAPESGTTDGGSDVSPPSSTAVAPTSKPAPSAKRSPRVKSTPRPRAQPHRPGVSAHDRGRAQAPRTDARPRSSSNRPAVRHSRVAVESSTSQPRIRRPIVETVGVGAGHELRPPIPVPVAPIRRRPPSVLVPALCNGVPALLALAAALAVARTRRRRRAGAAPVAAAQVHDLPRLSDEHRHMSRAA